MLKAKRWKLASDSWRLEVAAELECLMLNA